MSNVTQHHEAQLTAYLKYARALRETHLKEIDSTFEEVEYGRLMDDSQVYSASDVRKILGDVKEVVRGTTSVELVNNAHHNGVMLKGIFEQASKWHLKLDVDISALDNEELLTLLAEYERETVLGNNTSASILAAVVDGPSPNQLLEAEIARLKGDLEIEKARNSTVDAEAVAAKDEVAALTAELVALKPELADQAARMAVLEAASSRVKATAEAEVVAAAESSSGESSTALKAEVEELQGKLALSEKAAADATEALNGRLSKAPQMQSLQKMLKKKNSQLKEYRNMLLRHIDEDSLPGVQ